MGGYAEKINLSLFGWTEDHQSSFLDLIDDWTLRQTFERGREDWDTEVLALKLKWGWFQQHFFLVCVHQVHLLYGMLSWKDEKDWHCSFYWITGRHNMLDWLNVKLPTYHLGKLDLLACLADLWGFLLRLLEFLQLLIAFREEIDGLPRLWLPDFVYFDVKIEVMVIE